METGNNKNLNGFTTKNGSRDYDFLRSIGDYNMPIYKEMRALRCGEKPRKWEGAGSMPRCNFRSFGGGHKRILGTG